MFGEGYLYTYASAEEIGNRPASNIRQHQEGRGGGGSVVVRRGRDGRKAEPSEGSLDGFGFEDNDATPTAGDGGGGGGSESGGKGGADTGFVELYVGDEADPPPECGWHSSNGICTTPGSGIGGRCARHTCLTDGCGKGKSSADSLCTSCLHPEFGDDLDGEDDDSVFDAPASSSAAADSANSSNSGGGGGGDVGTVQRRGLNRRSGGTRPASMLHSAGALPDLNELRSAVETMIVEGTSADNIAAGAAGARGGGAATTLDAGGGGGDSIMTSSNTAVATSREGGGRPASGSWGFGGFDTGPTPPTSPTRASSADFDRNSIFSGAGQADLLAGDATAAEEVDQLNDPESLYNTRAGAEAAESEDASHESAYAVLPGNIIGEGDARLPSAQPRPLLPPVIPAPSPSLESRTSLMVSMGGREANAAAAAEAPPTALHDTRSSSNAGGSGRNVTAWAEYGAGAEHQEPDELDHYFGESSRRDSEVSEEAVPYRVMVPRQVRPPRVAPATTASAAGHKLPREVAGTAYLTPGTAAIQNEPADNFESSHPLGVATTLRPTLGNELDILVGAGGAGSSPPQQHARPSLADELDVIAGFGDYAVGGRAGVAGTRNSLYSRTPQEDGDNDGGSDDVVAPVSAPSVEHTAAVAFAWGATLEHDDSNGGAGSAGNGSNDGSSSNRESGVDLDVLMVDQANDPHSLYNGGCGGDSTLTHAVALPQSQSPPPIEILDPDSGSIYATALDFDEDRGSGGGGGGGGDDNDDGSIAAAAHRHVQTPLQEIEIDSLIESVYATPDNNDDAPLSLPKKTNPPFPATVLPEHDNGSSIRNKATDGRERSSPAPDEIVLALRDELSIMRNQLQSGLGLQSEVEALRSELHQLRHGGAGNNSVPTTLEGLPPSSPGRRPLLHPEGADENRILALNHGGGGEDNDESGDNFYYSEISAAAASVSDDDTNGAGGKGGAVDKSGALDLNGRGGSIGNDDDDIYGPNPDPNRIAPKKANKGPPPPLPVGGTSSRRPGSIWRGIGDHGPSPDNSTIELVAKMYGKRRDAILGGKHLVTQAEAVLLGALQIQIEYGEHVKPGAFNLRSVLPIEYADEPNAVTGVFEEQQNWISTTDAEARKEYIRVCRRSPTYGAINFLVKERVKGKGKALHKILGIAKDALLGIDVTSREVVNRYSLKSIRRWQAQPGMFTVELGDGGDAEKTELRFQTDQGQAISRLIAVVIAGYDKRSQGQQATLQRDGSRQNPFVNGSISGNSSPVNNGGKSPSALRASPQPQSPAPAAESVSTRESKKKSGQGNNMSESTLARQIAEALSAAPRMTSPVVGSSVTLPRGMPKNRGSSGTGGSSSGGGGESPEPLRHSSQTLPRSLGSSSNNIKKGKTSLNGTSAAIGSGGGGGRVSFDTLKAQMDALRKRAATNQRAFDGEFDPELDGAGTAADFAATKKQLDVDRRSKAASADAEEDDRTGYAAASGGSTGGSTPRRGGGRRAPGGFVVGSKGGLGTAAANAAASREADEYTHVGNLAQSGSWLYTQLYGKIKTGRKVARAAIKAMKNIDDVQLRSDPKWRRATQVSSAKHVQRHCTIIQDALEALVELTMVITEVGTPSADVDFGTTATWVSTIAQHMAPLARNVKICAAFVFDSEDMQSTWDGLVKKRICPRTRMCSRGH